MTTQLVMASTLFAAAGAAAAVDAGLLGPADERVLLVCHSAPVPELSPSLDEIPGAAPVLARFDRVVRLGDLVHPLHPQAWSPRDGDLPVLEKLLRSHWGLGDDRVELVLESLAVPPAAWLAKVFHASPVTVHSDGLMSYGPTRSEVPPRVAHRLAGLVHLDLVPGLRPVLLREHGVPATAVPGAALVRVVTEVRDAAPQPLPVCDSRTALALGQYLAALGIVDRDEETALHVRMIEEAAARGAERVLFKPHPSSPPGHVRPLRAAARRLGVELEVLSLALPVEVLFAVGPPGLVVGCFSTALATARDVFGIPVASVGTGLVLERLTPFENSNRIPATIVDALTRPGTPYRDGHAIQALVDAVAHRMQPRTLAAFATEARAADRFLGPDERARYLGPRASDGVAAEGVAAGGEEPLAGIAPRGSSGGVERVRRAVAWRARRLRRAAWPAAR